MRPQENCESSCSVSAELSLSRKSSTIASVEPVIHEKKKQLGAYRGALQSIALHCNVSQEFFTVVYSRDPSRKACLISPPNDVTQTKWLHFHQKKPVINGVIALAKSRKITSTLWPSSIMRVTVSSKASTLKRRNWWCRKPCRLGQYALVSLRRREGFSSISFPRCCVCLFARFFCVFLPYPSMIDDLIVHLMLFCHTIILTGWKWNVFSSF